MRRRLHDDEIQKNSPHLCWLLCMLFSLSVSAFAAEADEHTIYDSAPDEEIATQSESASSGTIPGSKIKWELNEHNWLTISGSGDCEPFTSKDDQPWAAVRDQITQVWFDDMDALHIADLAYWFEDCVNLTTAEIPGTTPIDWQTRLLQLPEAIHAHDLLRRGHSGIHRRRSLLAGKRQRRYTLYRLYHRVSQIVGAVLRL